LVETSMKLMEHFDEIIFSKEYVLPMVVGRTDSWFTAISTEIVLF
jgi:hypothetical protein